MEEKIELGKMDVRHILNAVDQALPELEMIYHEGMIKESVVEGMEKALTILKEALSKS